MPDHAPTPGARERLARAQADLLAALVAGAPVPQGFDPARVGAAAAVLVAKRRGVVARLFTELAAALGERYGPLFDAYAATCPKPDSARHDGLAFATHLAERGELPPHLHDLVKLATPLSRVHAMARAMAYRVRARLAPR